MILRFLYILEDDAITGGKINVKAKSTNKLTGITYNEVSVIFGFSVWYRSFGNINVFTPKNVAWAASSSDQYFTLIDGDSDTPVKKYIFVYILN